jgi:hypothetical protein
VLATVAAAWAVAASVSRAAPSDRPPGDIDPHEDNTFGLPDGTPIRRNLRRWYDRQLADVLGEVPTIGANLPTVFRPLADYDDPMASAMTPLISAYWDKGGKTTLAKLGLDSAEWRVVNPHLHKLIADQAFNFCQSTNATTTLKINDALAQLRTELAAGLVSHGESIPELTKRVQGIFTGLRKEHAAMIARTEASRAVHYAALAAAEESEVVEGKRWIASANSCDICLAEASRTKDAPIELGAEFTRRGDNPVYAGIKCPPLHPHCRCSLVFDLVAEYRRIIEDAGGHAPLSISPLDPSSPGVIRAEAA